MSTNKNKNKSKNNTPTKSASVPASPARIVRSQVPAGLEYNEYRNYLRKDFYHSCAYCTTTENEARAIRFTIDHYESRHSPKGQALVNEYSNLMWSCDECNKRKGDRSPPDNARASGIRFFRPDEDIHSETFELSGRRLNPKTPCGEYTIAALDLNRLALQRIREIRDRLTSCDELVAEGVLGLRNFSLDVLPTHVKGSAAGLIMRAINSSAEMVAEIDKILRAYAASDLIDDEPDANERLKDRTAYLKETEALYAGNWRGPRKKRDRSR